MDVVEALDLTFGNAQGVIAGLRADQLDDKTPCAEWTVRELLEHMIGVVAGMGAATRGESRSPFMLGTDPAAQFAEASVGPLAAWRVPGFLDRLVQGGPEPVPG